MFEIPEIRVEVRVFLGKSRKPLAKFDLDKASIGAYPDLFQVILQKVFGRKA